jgi:hypothetical protein
LLQQFDVADERLLVVLVVLGATPFSGDVARDERSDIRGAMRHPPDAANTPLLGVKLASGVSIQKICQKDLACQQNARRLEFVQTGGRLLDRLAEF